MHEGRSVCAPAFINPSLGPRPPALCLRELRVDRDLDVVADEHSTRLERDVPGETELTPFDLRRGAEPGLLVAPRIACAAALLDLQRHGPRHAGDREIARHAEIVAGAL